MNEFDILYIVWMWLLPSIGISLTFLDVVIWFFILPKISKKLMWARFKNSNIIALAGDSGWVELVVSTKTLPEGIHQTKEHGWRFQLRPRWTKEAKPENQALVEQLASRKYFLKDLGKPLWFTYEGKIPLVNPPTLAALQYNAKPSNPTPDMMTAKLVEFATTMPEHLATPLKKLVEELKEKLEEKAKNLTILDPKIIKETLPQMITPSQIDALAANRERYGELKRGHEYGKLALVAIVVLGMIALVIALGYFAMR
jgi:hypothetical protein